MKILICSDGMPASENAIDLAALLAGPLNAQITLLGIAEKSSDEHPLREALERAGAIFADTKCAAGYRRAWRRTGTADFRSNFKQRLRSRCCRRALDWSNRAVLALGKNIRGDQNDSAASVGGNR